MNVDYKARTGLTSRQKYEEMYKESIDSPASFWAKQAEGLAWRKKVHLAPPIYCRSNIF